VVTISVVVFFLDISNDDTLIAQSSWIRIAIVGHLGNDECWFPEVRAALDTEWVTLPTNVPCGSELREVVMTQLNT